MGTACDIPGVTVCVGHPNGTICVAVCVRPDQVQNIATPWGPNLTWEEVTSQHPVPKGELRAALSHHSLYPLQSRCPQAAPASWHQWPWPSSWVSDHGDAVPRGLVALCGTRTVSLAGWWLVAACSAQQREYGDRGRMGTEGGNCGQEASRGAEDGVQGQG